MPHVKTNAARAFTLIEIMIVVVIIGILAVALFPRLLGAIGRSSDESRKVALQSLVPALLQYRNDKGQFPGNQGCSAAGGTGGLNELVTEGYVDKSKMPADPNKNNKVSNCTGGFLYVPLKSDNDPNTPPNSSYMLVARMENGNKGNATAIPSGGDAKTIAGGLTANTGRYFIVVGSM